MKLLIEVNDLWIEEGELQETLVDHIKTQAVAQIRAQLRKEFEQEISKQIHEFLQKEMSKITNEHFSDFVEKGVILVSGKEVAIKDHLQNIFKSNTGWNNPHDKMAQLAKSFGEDMKKQYNAIFATKIVMNMREQGFLRDDMAQILLGNTQKPD